MPLLLIQYTSPGLHKGQLTALAATATTSLSFVSHPGPESSSHWLTLRINRHHRCKLLSLWNHCRGPQGRDGDQSESQGCSPCHRRGSRGCLATIGTSGQGLPRHGALESFLFVEDVPDLKLMQKPPISPRTSERFLVRCCHPHSDGNGKLLQHVPVYLDLYRVDGKGLAPLAWVPDFQAGADHHATSLKGNRINDVFMSELFEGLRRSNILRAKSQQAYTW